MVDLRIQVWQLMDDLWRMSLRLLDVGLELRRRANELNWVVPWKSLLTHSAGASASCLTRCLELIKQYALYLFLLGLTLPHLRRFLLILHNWARSRREIVSCSFSLRLGLSCFPGGYFRLNTVHCLLLGKLVFQIVRLCERLLRPSHCWGQVLSPRHAWNQALCNFNVRLIWFHHKGGAPRCL